MKSHILSVVAASGAMCAVLFTGCGKETPAQEATKAVADKVAAINADIVIKDMYLGMDIQKVPALLRSKITDKKFCIHDVETTEDGKQVAIGMLSSTVVQAGEDGKVIDLNDSLQITEKSVTGKQMGILSTGMEIKDVPMVLRKNQRADRVIVVHDVAQGDYYGHGKAKSYVVIETEDKISIATMLPFGMIKAEPDGKVNIVYLSTLIVNNMFNSAEMQPEEFLQKLVNVCHIPSMEWDKKLTVWSYVSPRGEKIIFDKAKNIVLQKVAGEADFK